MAKFKVGDKVKAIPMIASIANPERKGKVWEVTKVLGGDFYNLKADGKEIFNIPERVITAANSHCVNSTRPIVQMALNRTACNGKPKVGDSIWYTSKSRGGNLMKRKWDIIDENGLFYFMRLSDEPNGQINKVQKSIVQRENAINSSAPAGVVGNAAWNTTKLANDVSNALIALRNELTSELNIAIKAKANDKDEYDAHTQILGVDWIAWTKSRLNDLDAASKALSLHKY